MKPRGLFWPSLQRRICSADHLALFLDYDGTLVPIASHPSKAHLAATTRRLLQRLARDPRISVALVSGRSLRDVKRAAGLPRLWYIGNHGLEMQGPALRYVHPAAQARRPLMRRIARNLQVALRGIQGAWVEDKGSTLSVHVRRARPWDRRIVQQRFEQIVQPYHQSHKVELTAGKMVLEVRPPGEWNKGTAVEWLVERLRRSKRIPQPLPIYVGDDRTDEDAFHIVNQLGGISVFVGQRPRQTVARWWLRRPQQVREMLARITEARWQKP